MENMNKVILFLLLTFLTISAQENKSIHLLEHEYYSQHTQTTKPPAIPISLQKNNSTYTNNLNKIVFGFLPWWEYSAGSHHSIRYDLLTHIAISFFDSDGDGKITEPPYWPWNDLINKTKANNVKLIMCVSNFNGDQLHKLFTNQTAKQNLLNNILAKMDSYGFDGVNIDFENLLSGDEGSVLNEFMRSLTDFIKPKKPLSEISFDSPIVNSSIWDFKGLAAACDYLFVMGYDFYGSWSATTGPSAPLTGNYFSITKSLTEDYKLILDKLILGVPYYGNYWRTNSKDPYAKVAPYDSTKTINNWIKPALRYKEIIPQYASNEKMWDEISKTPWLRWSQNTLWNQIWYDDENSLALKYDLAILKNLKGIGIWALGYDDGRTELWNLIEKKFAKTTSVNENVASIPSSFELYQNYPNPFNPGTVISYQLSAKSYVQLKIFDLLGREVASLVNEEQTAGIYNSTFSTLRSALTSGVYIYSLKANGFIQSKKMIFLK